MRGNASHLAWLAAYAAGGRYPCASGTGGEVRCDSASRPGPVAFRFWLTHTHSTTLAPAAVA